MRENYYAAGDKVWDAWTDSQIRDFLVDHGMVKADRKYRRHQLDVSFLVLEP